MLAIVMAFGKWLDRQCDKSQRRAGRRAMRESSARGCYDPRWGYGPRWGDAQHYL